VDQDGGGGFWVVAPSRFGYFGSTLPPRATAAWSAAVYALLLDRPGIDRAIPFEELTVPTLIVGQSGSATREIGPRVLVGVAA
jgi:hypothetical protein